MASVLEFALRLRDRNNDAAAAAAGGAEIIIFPGVRMERMDFDADIFEPDEPQSPDNGQGNGQGNGHALTRKRAAKL